MSHNKIKVCMLVDNPGSNDVRVMKEAISLSSAGYEVVLIGENRIGERFPAEEVLHGVHVKRYCLPIPKEDAKAIEPPSNTPNGTTHGANFLKRPAVTTIGGISYDTPIREIPKLFREGYQVSEGVFNKIKFLWHVLKIYLYKVILFIRWQGQKLKFFLRRIFQVLVRSIRRGFRTNAGKARRIFSRYSRGYLRTIYRAVIRLDKSTHRYLTLMEMLKNEDADIYHAHDYPSLMIVVDAIGDSEKKIIYDSHELYFDRQPGDTPHKNRRRSYRLERNQEARAVQRTSFVITVSDSIAEIMAEKWNIPKPVVLRNVVKDSVPGEKEISFTQDGKRILVHSGNITYGRNLNQIVASLPYLPDNIALVLMGKPNPPILDKVITQAKELGCEDKINVVPPVKLKNVSETLSQADAGIVLFSQDALNYRFGLPNKLFEYIAAGIPVVVGQAKDIQDLVLHYNIGISCDEKDPASIAQAIETVLDPEPNETLRKNVMEARQKLNWQEEEKILVEAYRKLLS